jgi:hypothetical protein
MLIALQPEAACGDDAWLGNGRQLRDLFRVQGRRVCRLPMRVAHLIVVRDDSERQRDQNEGCDDKFDQGALRGDDIILPAIFVNLHAGDMGWKRGRSYGELNSPFSRRYEAPE